MVALGDPHKSPDGNGVRPDLRKLRHRQLYIEEVSKSPIYTPRLPLTSRDQALLLRLAEVS